MWQWNVKNLIDCVNYEKGQKQASFYFNKFLYLNE